MAASLQDIKGWFARGRALGAAYMVVATDTFDWEDYPVFCHNADDAYVQIDKAEKVMEVYDLNADSEPQFREHRVWSLPPREHTAEAHELHELVTGHPCSVCVETLNEYQHPKNRSCERTDEVLENYRRRAIAAETKLAELDST